MDSIRKGYFVEIEECSETGRRLEERWLDEQGRLAEYVEWNYHPEEMTLSRSKFDPETGARHAIGEPAATVTCLVSGVVFEEEYFYQDEPHREDGDAYIRRKRGNGQDEVRLRYIHGVEQKTVSQENFPKPQ